MKRPNPSFTVEIRRRPGRAVHPTVNLASLEIKPSRSEFDRDHDRAIAAIFGPKREPSAPVVLAKSAPTGRVLDSLVVDRGLAGEPGAEVSDIAETARDWPTADEPAARTKSRLVRTATPKARRFEPLAQPEKPPEPVAVAASPEPVGRASPATKTASPKPMPAKPKPSNQRKVVAEAFAPEPSAKISRAIPVVAAPAPEPPAKASEAAPGRRKRMILERYVYGNEPKPGERWKLRLRKKR